MTTYPPGAGPTAGAFAGEVYVPPAVAQDVTGGSGSTTTATRPTVASLAATADAQGRMVAQFVAPTIQAWLVRRIVVQSDTLGDARVYVGSSIDPANFVSGTITGNLDENDANQPYLVPEGQSMFVHWPAGGACMARIEYDVI